jgi:alpha-D-xyloside xylohydrolase
MKKNAPVQDHSGMHAVIQVLLIFLLFSACSQQPERVKWIAGDKINIDLDSLYINVQVLEENVLHIYVGRDGAVKRMQSLAVSNEPGRTVPFKVRQQGNAILLQTEAIIMRTNLETGASFITDLKGNVLLKERKCPQLKSTVVHDDEGYEVEQFFRFSDTEAIYGFGQHQDGIMNYRGKSVDLYQHNMKVAVPVMVSSRGYGIFWDHYCYSRFDDGETGCFWSELVDGLDYYFIYGPEPDEVVGGIRRVTGQAPLYPKWVYGFIQSRARYETQEEVLQIVREYRRREVPLDVIVQDWQYWPGSWGAKEFDRQRYPDPEGMMDELHNELNAHLLISIWPCLEPGSRDFDEMYEAGFLYPSEGRYYYDPFHPEARELFWKQTKTGLFDHGVDAWWADATEPEINGWETDLDDYKSMMKPAIGSAARYLNAYSLMQAKGLYEGQRSVTADKRVFIMTRSAFAGQQRYGAATWSGDVSATWETFRKQISAGLNFTITGIPYWTSDIGAFFVTDHEWFRDGHFPKGVEDPEYREFFVRWYQFGAFCPLFRVHGAQTPREIWHFGDRGDPCYDIQVKYDKLRYRLLPYIYSMAGMITHEHYTMMRPLMMDFRYDTKVHDIDDQYMFGPSFMVCPVTAPDVKSRPVYLPECEGGWYDFWTGRHFPGGQAVEAFTDLETLPLFVKSGSIIPMGPHMQYSTEKPPDPLELRIYPGTDGYFALYEDEGDNYNYENGQSSTIQFAWKQKPAELIISHIAGSFPGMLSKRVFKIVRVTEGKGVGLEPEENSIEVKYQGMEYSLKIN